MLNKNKILAICIIVLISFIKLNAVIKTSIGSGNWNVDGTWDPSGVPGVNDTVIIASGHTITMNGNPGSCYRLIIDGTANWTTVLTTNVGAGGIVINAGGDITGTVNGVLTSTGGLTINSILTSNTVGITLQTTVGQTIAGTGSLAVLTINATATNTGTLTVRTTLGGSSTLTNGVNATLNIGAATVSPTLTATANPNIVRYYGTTAQTVKGTTYHHLTIDKPGQTATLGAATIVNGDLAITAGTLSVSTYTLSVGGNLVVNGTLSGSGTITLSGAGTTIDGTGLVTHTGSITISGNKTIPAGANLTFSGTLSINTGITVTNNGVITANGNITGGGATATWVNASGSTLNVGSAILATGTLNANAVPNTVNYSSTTASQTVKGTTYHNLTITKGTQTATLGAATTVNGDLTVTSGTLSDGSFQITGNAIGTLTVASGATLQIGTGATATTMPTFNTYILTGSTIIYGSTSAQTIASTPTYHNLTLSNTSTKTASGALMVNGNLIVNAGPFADGGNTITIKGNVTMNGTHSGTGKILLSGGSALHILSGTGTYTNLELDDANGATINASFTIAGTLTLTNGVFAIGANTLTLNGTVSTGSGSITGGTSSNLTVGGTGATLNLPTITNGLNNLTLNRANGMILNAPLSLNGTLTLTNGIITTSADNLLTINNTVIGAISGGSTSSYIRGPLARTLPANLSSGSIYSFPIGKSAYKLVRLVNPTTGSSGSVVIRAEVFDENSGGQAGTGLTSINTDRYWQVSITQGATNFNNTQIRLFETNLLPYNRIGRSANQNGDYASIGGTGIGDSITSNVINALDYFVIGVATPISGSWTIGTGGNYPTLREFFNFINSCQVNENIVGNVISNITDNNSAVLNAVNYVGGPWQIRIQPHNGNWVLSGSVAGPLVDLNGADYIVFDGNGKNLTFRNTSSSGQTFVFRNDATYDTIISCIIEGCNTTTTSGTIVFSTTDGATGNDNNVITDCDVRDRSDASATPLNAIYSAGTPSKENSGNVIANNNIYNFWGNSSNSNGILIASNSTDWTVTNNNFYQTANRTGTTAGVERYGIRIANSSSGYNFVVSGNYIGGSTAGCAGSAWTVGGNVNQTFVGIYLDAHTGSTNSIQGNTIANINWNCSNNSTSAAPGIFCGIYVLNGGYNIGTAAGNTIGSESGTGSITVTTTTSGPRSFGIAHGGSSGTINISNNKIGSITIAGSSVSISHSFTAIVVAQAGSASTRVISNNLIGSLSAANSINAITSSIDNTSAQSVIGITTSGGTNVLQITNNTIANLNNNYNGTGNAGQIRGIVTPYGTLTITSNTIRNLSTTSQSAGVGASSSVIGIASSSTTAGLTMSQNIIHSLTNTAASTAASVTGIYYSGPTSGSNIIARNFIHSIGLSTSSTSAVINGFYIDGGVSTFQNNMIRLGIDASGNAITTCYAVNGIVKAVSNNNKFFFNSVYIGGSGVGTTATNTYAFRRTATGTDTVYNNIFVNARSNATTGGKHFAIGINSVSNFASNYNVFWASGSGGVMGQVGTTDYSFSNWKSENLIDFNSGYADPQFVNPTGNNQNVDLHIKDNEPTPIEARGVNIASVIDDYDGQTRSTLTPVDIGADAGNFIPSDIIPPTISYLSLPNTHLTDNRQLKARIVDDRSGVAVSAGKMPRLYYKKHRFGSWFQDSVWTTVNDTFTFTFDHSKLGGVTGGDSIFYYVAAQDTMDNVNTNPLGGSGATPPGSTPPTSLNAYLILPTMSGNYYIGFNQTYPTLKSFFDAINSSVITGPITGTIVSDLSEGLSCVLNPVNYGAGGPYPIRIVHDNSTNIYTVAGSITGPLISLNGADYLTIDGLNKRLRFRNTSTSGQTFIFQNDATYDTIMNCIIEGCNSSSTSGTIVFGTTTYSFGNDNNVLFGCDIRDRSDVSARPVNAIYSSGTTGQANSHNSIVNNEIFNFTTRGIQITGTGNGDNWIIDNNSFYYIGTATGPQTVIDFTPGDASNKNEIKNNFIGGSERNCGGSAWINNGANLVRGIRINCGTSITTIVQNNTIQNFNIISTTTQNSFEGIRVHGRGRVTISENIIGHSTVSNSIIVAGGTGTTTPGWIFGIYDSSNAAVKISDNVIANMQTSNVYSYVVGIFHNPDNIAAVCTIINNRIYNLTTNSGLNLIYHNYIAMLGIYLAKSYNNLVENNTIYGLRITNGATQTYGPTVCGILFTVANTQGKITRNRIYDLTNQSGGSSWPSEIIGIMCDEGVFEVSNNQISLTNAPYNRDLFIYGIIDYTVASANSAVNYYYNSIYLGGTNNGTQNSSYCFLRIPGGDGTVQGGNVQFRNNIFFNYRSGGSNSNIAIGNIGNYLNSGWPASASDYNLLVSPLATTVGRWGGGPANNRTFEQWKAVTGGDNNSISYVSGVGQGQLNPNDLFESFANGDLHIKPTSVIVNRKATPLAAVTVDYDNEPRHLTRPDIGADEYNLAAPNPFNLISPTNNAPNQDTMGSLIWYKSVLAEYYDVLLDTLNPPTQKVSALQSDTFYNYYVKPGKTYFWRIRSINDTTISKAITVSDIWSFSTINPIPPYAPSDLTISELSTNSMVLEWEDNSHNENGFYIRRDTLASGSFPKIDSVSSNVTSYGAQFLSPNTHYFWRVSAYNNYRESDFTAKDTWTLAMTPAMPTLSNIGVNSVRFYLAPNNNPLATMFAVRVQSGSITKYLSPTGNLVDDIVWDTYQNFGGSAGKLVTGLMSSTEYTFDTKARNGVNIETDYGPANSITTTVNPPQLISPIDSLITNDTLITFVWHQVLGADSFNIIIRNNSTELINAIIVDTSYIPTNAFTQGNYYWKVRAKPNNSIWSQFSLERTFVIDLTGPLAPTLISPSGLINDTTPTFIWGKVNDAVLYHLVVNRETEKDVVIDIQTTDTSYTVPDENALSQGNYTWAVRAKDAAGNWGPFTSLMSFNINLSQPPTPGWTNKKDLPTLTYGKYIKDGGSLVAVGSYLYALRGNKSNEFYKYFPHGDSWSRMESIPFTYKPGTTTINNKKVANGASLCYDGENTIYATKGNNTYEFWKYDLVNDTWLRQAYVPSAKPLKGGTALVFKNHKVYLLAGSQKVTAQTNFFEFTPNADTGIWVPKIPGAPITPDNKAYKDGSCLAVIGDNIYALKGGGKHNYFHKYDGTTWTPLEIIPLLHAQSGTKKAKVKSGGAMTSDSTGLYAIKGGGSQQFWKYTPATPTGTWIDLETIPKLHKKSVPKNGAALAYANAKVYLIKGNNTSEFLEYTPSQLTLSRITPMTYTSVNTEKTPSASIFSIEATPNPFNRTTAIRYNVSVPGKISIRLYNATGRLISTLTDKYHNAASYTISLSAKHLAKGIYFLKYEDMNNSKELKLVVQ